MNTRVMLTDGMGKVKKTGHLHCFTRPPYATIRDSTPSGRTKEAHDAATHASRNVPIDTHRPGPDGADPGRSPGKRVTTRRLGQEGNHRGGGPDRVPRAQP